jgi:hypothetical protein
VKVPQFLFKEAFVRFDLDHVQSESCDLREQLGLRFADAETFLMVFGFAGDIGRGGIGPDAGMSFS